MKKIFLYLAFSLLANHVIVQEKKESIKTLTPNLTFVSNYTSSFGGKTFA